VQRAVAGHVQGVVAADGDLTVAWDLFSHGSLQW